MRTLALFVAGLYANPCQNGGRFVDLSYRGQEEILCICADGFEGDNCEISYGIDKASGPGSRHLGGISSFAQFDDSDRIKKEKCEFIEVTPTLGIKVLADVEDTNQACWVFYTSVDPNYQMNIELLTIAEEGACHDDHADYYFVPDKLQVVRKMYRKNYAAEAIQKGCLHGGRVSTFGDYTYMSVIFLGGEGRTIPPTFQLTYGLDTNECTTGDNNCHMHANCENTVGAYTCECGDNHVGDGVVCIDTYEKVWFDKQNHNIDVANAALDAWEEVWDELNEQLTLNDLHQTQTIDNQTAIREAEDDRLQEVCEENEERLALTNTEHTNSIDAIDTLLVTANTEIEALETALGEDIIAATVAFTDPQNPDTAVKEILETEYAAIGTKLSEADTAAQGADTTFRETFDDPNAADDHKDLLDLQIADIEQDIINGRTACDTAESTLQTLFEEKKTATATKQTDADGTSSGLDTKLSAAREKQMDEIEQWRSLTDSFSVYLRTNKDAATDPPRVVFDGIVQNPKDGYQKDGDFAGVFKATIPGLYYFQVNAKFAYTGEPYDLRLTKLAADNTSADKAVIQMNDVNRLGRDYHSMSAIVWMEEADQIHVQLMAGMLYNDAGGAQTTFNGFLIHPQPTHTIA